MALICIERNTLGPNVPITFFISALKFFKKPVTKGQIPSSNRPNPQKPQR
jgi:hypothetical protein